MSTRAKTLSGEAEAMAEIATTVVTPGGRLVLLSVFLGAITVIGILNLLSLGGPWSQLAGAVAGHGGAADRTLWRRLNDWNDGVLLSLRGVEKGYDEKSPFCMNVQPVVQGMLSRIGEGSDEVVLGEDGWLFHRNAVRFMTRSANKHRQSPPLAAITSFAEALKSRGIQLVLMPVPPKLAIYPEKFGQGLPAKPVLPPVWSEWKAAVEAAGVRVFDLMPVLAEARSTAKLPLFLKTDTHWTPEAVEIVSAQLGRFLTAEGLLPPADGTASSAADQTVTAIGDLRRMLRLAETSPLFPQETVTIREVRTATGMRWQNSDESELLLMGDSFCNIFSQKSLGWGTGAGFAEHLGRAIGRPVSAILRNGDGAFATRAILSRSLQTGHDRLKGAKVVVWEFDATQLTEGEWKPLGYSLSPAPASQFVEVAAKASERLIGTVVSVSPAPVPGTVAYKDYVATLHLREVRSADGRAGVGTELLAYGLAMKDNRWTPLAEVRPGEVLEVQLKAWGDVEAEFGPFNRADPEGDLLLQPINWLDSFTVRSTSE